MLCFARLTLGIHVSESLPWNTCPMTPCSSWCRSCTRWCQTFCWNRARPRTHGPTWTLTVEFCYRCIVNKKKKVYIRWLDDCICFFLFFLGGGECMYMHMCVYVKWCADTLVFGQKSKSCNWWALFITWFVKIFILCILEFFAQKALSVSLTITDILESRGEMFWLLLSTKKKGKKTKIVSCLEFVKFFSHCLLHMPVK